MRNNKTLSLKILFLTVIILAMNIKAVILFASNDLGTKSNPYLISTSEQLIAISNDLSGTYKLLNDIDLENNLWKPIGTGSEPFKGNFDGNGFSIQNLTIDEPQKNDVGLFGYIDGATIENISLNNINITGKDTVGVIAGTIKNGKVINSSVKGDGIITGKYSVGGITGFADNVVFERCYVTVDVVAQGYAGGLAGVMSENGNNTIFNCYTITNLTCNDFSAGGLVAYAINGTIANSYSVVNISGPAYQKGGLVGDSDYGLSIVNSYYDNTILGYDETLKGAKTTNDLKTKSTYTSWEFNNVWSIENEKYPELKYLPQTDISKVEQMEGAGTTENPYLVKNKYNLKSMKENLSASYKLSNDIDLENDIWDPVGTSQTPFKGSFDGNGYKIKNVYIPYLNRSNLGFFGYAEDVKIENITIENINIIGQQNLGSLVGYIKNGKIINASVIGGSITGTNNVAGLAGNIVATDIERSKVIVDVSASGIASGIIGKASGIQTSNLYNCYARGNVSSLGDNIGGIVGDPSDIRIVNCYYAGKITGTSNSFVGGIIGSYGTGVYIVNSYYDSTLSTKVSDKNGARTTEQLQTKLNFEGWRFDSIWTFENNGYPQLVYFANANAEKSEEMLGEGTIENPYLIKTIEHLESIKNNLSASYKLASDIDLGDKLWEPIGTVNEPFTGNFDGDGHVISNLYMIQGSMQGIGLFGNAKGSIFENTNIKNVYISSTISSSNTGSLVGYIADGQVRNVSVISTDSITGEMSVGGLVGASINTTYEQCFTEVDVNGYSNVGGLVGNLDGSGNAVLNCYSKSDVATTTYYNVGGLIGLISSSSTITNSFAVGTVTPINSKSGGLVGNRSTDAVITSSYFNSTTANINNPVSEARTTEQLNNKNTFEGWDFEKIWGLNDGMFIPTLKPKNSSGGEVPSTSTSYKYDKLGRIVEVTSASGKITKYTYDANGNILTIENTIK